MSTIRTDPVTGRRVIIAAERTDRPRTVHEHEDELSDDDCPFCPGHEAETPPPRATYCDEAGDWTVRVVPNKYPALEAGTPAVTGSGGLFESHNGVGVHDVIVESPEHVFDLHDLSEPQVATVVGAWRDRLDDLADDDRLAYALIFKNHGAAAGASIAHTHSQLLALPMVPRLLDEELDGARSHHDAHGECIFCQIIDQTLETRDRIVFADDALVVMAPYAPRFPFELRIIPRTHSARFTDGAAAGARQVAAALRRTLDRLDRALGAPPYNLAIHTAPLRSPELSYYHWHIELIPTLSHIAGFEWGSGYHINPTPPEEAARRLRAIDREADGPAD
jgi:UDPglucose--hexose-1-phosphate uridylyltransferase